MMVARLRSVRRRTVRLGALLATTTVAALAVTLSVTQAQAADSQFTPGQAWTDTPGNTLQLHGMGIVKSGATWYAFGENLAGENAGDAYFEGISCYSSPDLLHWAFQGYALAKQPSGDLGPNRIVERPKVIYNSGTKTFVMYMHIDSSSYNEAKVGVATSSTPCGSYHYRGSFQPLGQQSRDIGLFRDTNGDGYLLSEDRAHGLRLDKLSSDYLSVVSAVTVFSVDDEAPAMVKVGSTYYVLGSPLTNYSAHSDDDYATATSLSGTWSAFRKFAPVGTNTYNTQTGNVIPVQGSSGTTYIYAGDVWNPSNLGNSGLEFLPMEISGTTVTVGWQSSWTLDTSAGTWTGSSNPANAVHYLTNQNSSLVMDATGAATTNGTSIEQWTLNQGTNQQWKLTRVSGSLYTITDVGSDTCLEVPNNSTTAGTQFDIRTCDGRANQLWALNETGKYIVSANNSYVLVNMNSGQVADASGRSTSPGAQIIQWGANGQTNQIWNLT